MTNRPENGVEASLGEVLHSTDYTTSGITAELDRRGADYKSKEEVADQI